MLTLQTSAVPITVLLDCDWSYFEPAGEEIDPGPEPDPRIVAERLAATMEQAYRVGGPQPVTLHTVRIAADRWRQYTVLFDGEHQEIVVRIGPVVSTGQVPLPGTDVQRPWRRLWGSACRWRPRVLRR